MGHCGAPKGGPPYDSYTSKAKAESRKSSSHARVLGLRPDARDYGEPGTVRRHRSDVPEPRHRRNVLSSDAAPGVRRLGDVVFVVPGVEVSGTGPVHCHSDLSLAVL